VRAGTSTGVVLKDAQCAEPRSFRSAPDAGAIADLMTAIAPAVVQRPAPLTDARPFLASRARADGPSHVAGHARSAAADTTT
jgi:hypothetical protein